MSRLRVKEVTIETFEPFLEGCFKVSPVAKEQRVEKKKSIAMQKEEDAESSWDLGPISKESVFAVIIRSGFVS